MLCCPIYNREILQKLGAKVDVHSRCLKKDGCFLGTAILPQTPQHLFHLEGICLPGFHFHIPGRAKPIHCLLHSESDNNSLDTVLLVIRTAVYVCVWGVMWEVCEGSILQVSFYYQPVGMPTKSRIYCHQDIPFGDVLYNIVGKGR